VDEKVSIEPQLQDRSLLAADRITEETRRIETDVDGNIYVNVAGGSIAPSGTQDVNIVGSDIDVPVEVQNFPAIQTVDGTIDIGNFPATQQVTQGTSPWIVDGSGVVQPVSGPLTDTQLRASPVPISGTVTATPSGTQDVNIVSTISLPVTGPLTDVQLRAVSVPISGTVAVSNFPATQPVSGTVTANQGTNPWIISGAVTGPLTDAQLRATPVPISGTVTANLGTVDGLALDSTLTGGTQKTRITDGTDNLDITVAGAAKVDGSAVTQPISAVSLPLPTGATTEVTLATRLADGTFTTRINTLGQKNMANSTPIVIASDQSAVPISATSLPLPTGASTEAKQTQPGVDIGDVTVNNASGAGSVNIQDGGNSITVDAVDLDIRNLSHTQDSVKVGDGSDFLTVETLGNIFSAADSRLFTINNKTYGISFDINAASGGADNTQILIRNPNGSGKILYFYTISAGVQINNVFITYKVFANPTITTNGTVQTPISLNIGGGAAAAIALINTLPTVSVAGSAISSRLMSQNGTGVELTQKGIIALNPNNSMLITANPQSNNRISTYTIQWAEI